MEKYFESSLESLVMVWVFAVQGIAGSAMTTFSCERKASPNETFIITCSITGTIENGIQWIRPDGTQVATCSDATNCLTFPPGYNVKEASNLKNVLEIDKFRDMDGGKWTCQDGTDGDKGCEIIGQKTPTTALTIISTQSTYSVGDTLEVSVDVKDYYCSRAPSFHLLLDSQRVELDALPSTPLITLSGTQTKSITVTKEMTGSIKLVFNCRDDDVLFEKTFEIPDTPGSLGPGAVAGIVVVCVCVATLVIVVVVVVVLKKNEKCCFRKGEK